MSSAGVVGFFGILLFVFLAYLAQVFIMLLVARAIGYWTLQFDVPRWRGQDDPMPFEAGIPFAGATPVNPAAAAPDNQAPYNQAPYSQAPYNPAGQPMQPGVVQQPPYFAGQPTQPGTAQQPPYPYAQPTEPVVNQPYGSSLQSIPPTQQPMQDMTGTAPSYAQPEPVQTAPVQASTQPLVDDVAASADQAASDAPVAPPMAEDGGADRGLQEE